jgi:hypothetical protein
MDGFEPSHFHHEPPNFTAEIAESAEYLLISLRLLRFRGESGNHCIKESACHASCSLVK